MSLERAQQHLVSFAHDIDQAIERARKLYPADRIRVLESSAAKMATTFERLSHQLIAFQDQYERFGLPPRGPQGPARIYPWRPKKRR